MGFFNFFLFYELDFIFQFQLILNGMIVFFQVFVYFQNSWESYYLEILMVIGLFVYIMNYIIGKNKNSRFVQVWFNIYREFLESNFVLVGKLG